MNKSINELRLNTEIAKAFFAQKLAFTLGPVELTQMLAENKVKLIDVRRKEDFDKGHISGAISIPKAELNEKMNDLSKKDVHVLYCYNQQCHLAASAAYNLACEGYPVMELEGGIDIWVNGFNFELTK